MMMKTRFMVGSSVLLLGLLIGIVATMPQNHLDTTVTSDLPGFDNGIVQDAIATSGITQDGRYTGRGSS